MGQTTRGLYTLLNEYEYLRRLPKYFLLKDLMKICWDYQPLTSLLLENVPLSKLNTVLKKSFTGPAKKYSLHLEAQTSGNV